MRSVDADHDNVPRKSDLADSIVEKILSKFNGLPPKYKPAKDSQGNNTWVTLSGIVFESHDGKLECISLATGVKCLPASKVAQAGGRILHDCHAEVLALRGLNHFLLQECKSLREEQDQTSKYLRRSASGPALFTVDESIKMHMYSSEAPCGDASMELIMERQDDATPWDRVSQPEGLLGRGHFSELGIVRRKPSRGDSPESLSKSCSDKLALKQCTSVLSAQLGRFIEPSNAYLTSLIVPESQFIPGAFERCFGTTGRMGIIADSIWPGGYLFRPFDLLTTTKEFSFSRRSGAVNRKAMKPSNVVTIWTCQRSEVVINGVLQGRRQGDPEGSSMLSRIRLHAAARQVEGDMREDGLTYVQSKQDCQQLVHRAHVKDQVIEHALPGWIRNVQDDF